MVGKTVYLLGSFLIGLLLAPCYAGQYSGDKLQSSTTAITHFDEVKITLMKQTDIPVLFPQKIVVSDKQKLFASKEPSSSDPSRHSGYRLFIDSTAECRGVHVCNVGSMAAELAQNPQIYYDVHNKEITEPVMLEQDTKAYYTPAHAMGRFWPTMISWRCQNVLYTLSWNLNPSNQKQQITDMANSALATGKCHA